MTSPTTTLPPHACICGKQDCNIPYGQCHCGCGEKTNIANRSKGNRGHIKGRPIPYILQHHARDRSIPVKVFPNPIDVPFGYCYCGCKEKTHISENSDARTGREKGKPKKFLLGHNITIPNEHFIWPTLDDVGIAVFLIEGMRSGVMVVDVDFVPLLIRCRWNFNGDGYAVGKMNGKSIKAHQFIAGLEGVPEVDHKNRVRFDNRRDNLRPSDVFKGKQNQGIRRTNTSGYKGVRWHRNCWEVAINANKIRYFIGSFPKDKLVEAARAYDRAARLYHGEFACTNFRD